MLLFLMSSSSQFYFIFRGLCKLRFLYKTRLQDGVILDEKVFHNDYVNLAHGMGVFLYDDLLAIVSLRYQMIHILQIRDSGNLFNVRAIGAFCREDDELFLNSCSQVYSNVISILSIM